MNTTDSRVELSFDLARSTSIPPHVRARMIDRLGHRMVDGVVTIAASEYRAQRANRQAARDRLARLLREAAQPPPPPRRASRPSRASKERRLAEKRRRADVKRGRQGHFD